MQLFKNLEFAHLTFIIIFLLPINAVAADDKVIAQYEQFNNELLDLNLSNYKSSIFGKSPSLDRLKGFYSSKMRTYSEECYSHSRCRESDIIFLGIASISKRNFIGVEKINDELAKLGVRGKNTSGIKVQLTMTWLMEDGSWKLDKIMKIPYDWNPFKSPIENMSK